MHTHPEGLDDMLEPRKTGEALSLPASIGTDSMEEFPDHLT